MSHRFAARILFFGAGLCLLLTQQMLRAAEETSSVEKSVSFVKEIAPIFSSKCQTCHNTEKSKGGYQLESFETVMNPGDSKEPPIVPGDSKRSKLYQLITTADADDRMPQKADALPAGQVALIEKWISQGALFDGTNHSAPLSSFATSAVTVQTPVDYSQPVPILALAFNIAKHELVASGYGEVTFWNPANGELLRRINQLPQKIQALAFTRDGTTLAIGGGSPGSSGEALLVKTATLAERRTLGLFPDIVLDLKFSPDETRLATAGADNSIRLYDVASGKQQLLIQQHADWVTGIDFSRDGKRIVSSSRDRTCRIFDATTGELETTYVGHEVPVLSVVFSPDDKFACSAGRDKRIHLWTLKDGKKTNELAAAEGETLRLVADGGRLFACSSDKLVREYNFSDKEVRRTFSGHSDWVYSLATDSVNHWLATGAFDGEVRLWDLNSGELIHHFIAAPGLRIQRAAR
jgi:hypothetical protein